MEITTEPCTCGSTRRALESCYSSAAPIARIHGQANGTSPVRGISLLGIPPSSVQGCYYWFCFVTCNENICGANFNSSFLPGESWRKS
jgi:hypothetical protein